jgi:hypothetical protein
MRAVTQRSFGGAEVLELGETARPVPREGEVLVRVRAAAVNPVDAAVRSGALPLLGEPPFGVGWDISGVVEEAAPGSPFAVGEEVFGMPRFPGEAGGYAEYVAAPAAELARKPVTLDHVHAAALPLAGLTAWQGLVTAAGIGEGGRVLKRQADFSPSEPFRLRVSDGEVLLHWSHNNHDMWRAGAGFNRPKWGIYRSLNNVNALRDETVLFNDFCIAEGTNTCPTDVNESSFVSSSSSSSASSAGAGFDFESDTLGAAPSDFVANGPVVVSNEQARSGSQSVKLSHPIEQAVNLRGQFEPTNTGSLKASIYIPGGVGVDSFISVYADSFAGDQRAIDIIFKPNGAVRRREGANAQIDVTTYTFDEWHDVEIHWDELSVSNEFTLVFNGVVIGTFVSANPGLVPTRVEFKFGQNNAAISAVSIFIDEVSVF